MPITITMPRLSDTMESGTIIKWNVKEGDKVSAGDVIADVETDKATMEMSAYDDGTVAKIVVPEGKSVSVGTVIAVLAGEGEDLQEAAKAVVDGAAGAPSRKTSARPEAERGESPRVRSEAGEPPEAQVVTGPHRGQPKPATAHAGRIHAAEETRDQRQKEKDEEEAEAKVQDERKPRPEPAHPEKHRDGRIFVSPMARRLAEEHELDLRSIEGTGPGGRIIKRDVLKAAEAAEETAAAVAPSAREGAQPQAKREIREDTGLATRVPMPAKAPRAAERGGPIGMPGLHARTIQLSGMRQTIAKRLVESKSTIPHYQVTVTFDMDALLELRSTLNEQLQDQGVKLSVNDFLVRACALAMYDHPEFNASWSPAPQGAHIEVHGDVNIGIAISVPAERGGGLVVATIRNADQKSLRVISYESKMLADKARTRGLTIEEMSDSTFTISNLGMFGVDNFTAIINPPNSAIIAVGAAVKKPVVRNDQLTIGQEMNATLSCDHRVIDGAMAAKYLQTLKGLIENPATLLV